MRKLCLMLSTWIASVGLLPVLAAQAVADEKANKASVEEDPVLEVIPITVHPAAAPKPALRYHLLPTFLQQTPGDAVPLYAKAFVIDNNRERFIRDQTGGAEADDQWVSWAGMALDALPRDQVRKLLDASGSIFSQLELASRREHCNWDAPLRQGRVFEISLPEIQASRNLARLLTVRARLQIAEGNFAEAIASLEIGYSIGRQVAEQPLLISGLVGNSFILMMNYQLLTLCQQPGAPNLYWSLTDLPCPMVNLVKSAAAEYDGLYLQYPELQNVRTAQYTPEYWDQLLRDYVNNAKSFVSDKDKASVTAENVIAKALEAVPRAKTELIAAGYSKEELDKMPPARIVLLHGLTTYDILRDEMFKWSRVPFWQASQGLDAVERRLKNAASEEILPAASLVLPAMRSVAIAQVRQERQFAALRCIEAIRLHLASHEGKLPASLDDIQEVPMPINPATGKPFPYRLEGDTAVLNADGGPTDGSVKRAQQQYRITVAK